uniref:CCHC-type domain-containing protein n=1 Tax=Tanacetum cinerariifolium TaxID=118510 RepID=A0A6L2NXT7_TANCI|nr:hypothetical protein [Tanacetum cinerariifolium]
MQRKKKTYNSNWKGKAAKGKSDRGSKRKVEYEIAPTSDPKEAVCLYCNTKGHWKRSCPKYPKDLKDKKVKKGSHSGMFMIELYNTTTSDSWVLDTGCGTYICTVLQGLKKSRRLKHGELNLVMGNMKITSVIRIGKYELMLKSGVMIDLNNCKMTKSPFTGSCERGEGLLDIVHTDMCGPFQSATKDGKCYYVTFTHDFSRYGYVYLIKHMSDTFKVFKGERPSFRHIKIWGCEVLVRREVYDKLEARSKNCLFISYPEESFGYLFYKSKDNVVSVAQRGVFLDREMISKEDSGSKINLEEIQDSINEEPIVNTDTQQEVVTPVKPDDISLPICKTSGRVSKPPKFYYGFYIEEDKIIDSTLSELDEPANYKEAMTSPEATEWEEAMKNEIQSMYDNQV